MHLPSSSFDRVVARSHVSVIVLGLLRMKRSEPKRRVERRKRSLDRQIESNQRIVFHHKVRLVDVRALNGKNLIVRLIHVHVGNMTNVGPSYARVKGPRVASPEVDL